MQGRNGSSNNSNNKYVVIGCWEEKTLGAVGVLCVLCACVVCVRGRGKNKNCTGLT